MSKELKPCPFCGEKGVIKAINKNYGLTIWCQCKKCGARTEGYCPNTNNEDETIESIEQCKNRAVTLWNRRANDMMMYEVAELVEDLIEIVKGGGVK